MDDRTEVLSLRRVAARFISTDEQTGLAELDRIAADASRVIQKRYWLLSTTSAAIAFATAVTPLPWLRSGPIDQIQKMTVAASATAEKKAFGHRS